MSSNIEWVTGPVHTGKTTRLGQRIAENPAQYCGLLAPVDDEGRRYLQNIITGEKRMLDCSPKANDAVLVGPYAFSGEVFKWGRAVLLDHHTTYPNRTLVIDEIGKLELRGAGLADACWEVMEMRNDPSRSVLIIVRETLENAVKDRIA